MSKKRRALKAVFITTVILLSSLVIFIRQQYVAPILMYHSVNPQATPKNRLEVSVESFRRQMRFLKEHKYNCVSIEELAGLIREKKKIPARTVAITFDDGYKDNYIYAFPILQEYGLKATLFIILKEVGRYDRLSWDEIMRMQDSGLIRVGSHALGPDPLVKAKSEEELRGEIFESKRALEERLGRPVEVFSYPEGRFNDHIRQLVVDAGYKAAVATNPGKKYPSQDVFALKRLRISSTSDNLGVFWFESSGYYNFIREHRHK